MKLVYMAGSDPHHMRIRAAELISKGIGAIIQWDLGGHDDMFLMLMATNPTYWRTRISDMEQELMRRCDALYLCSDWKQSEKAKTALAIARQQSKQVLIEGIAEPITE
jgi:hypothetical protein